MVQDLATQVDPVVSVQNKNFSGNRKELAKVLGADKEANSHLQYTIPWNLASPVKNYPRIIVLLHVIRSETNGIAERQQCVGVKERTPAVLLQSGLDKEWWADSMECYCYPRLTERHHVKGGSETI